MAERNKTDIFEFFPQQSYANSTCHQETKILHLLVNL